MKSLTDGFALLALAVLMGVAGTGKPRVFIAESGTTQLSGDAAVGDAQGKLSFTGGSSPQSVEVDLVYSNSTRLLRNAVKDACAAITGQRRD